MMQFSLQLAEPLDRNGVNRVMDALHALSGVVSVEAASGMQRVDIGYDDQRTSPQELMAVLMRNGYRMERKHEGGGCCGGCGGHA